MRQDVHRATPFDSHFAVPLSGVARLTFRVNTHLAPYVPNIPPGQQWELVPQWPHTAGATLRKVVSWDTVGPGEETFPQWAQRFKSIIEREWSGHLYLVPTGGGRGYRFAPIRCFLEIHFVGRADRSHLNLRIYRLHESETFFRSSMSLGGHCKRGMGDGSLDHRDIDPKSNGQIAAVHEMGHYLGLDHVARGTATPYGAPGSYQAGDIMGSGMRRDAWHAWPWLHRLPLHEVSSTPMSIYPRGVEWVRSLRPTV